jgi:hypothetical protein
MDDDDIHEQLEIDFKLSSVAGPHRYGEFDDDVRLIDRILPVT